MKKLPLKNLVLSIVFFIAGSLWANAAPEYAEISPKIKDASYLILIDQDEKTTYYLLEEEVYKIITLSDYPKTKNWQLKIFFAPKQENLKQEYETIIPARVEKGIYIECAGPDSPKTYWATALELSYNFQAQTATVINIYTYNELGEILTTLKSPESKIYKLGEYPEIKNLCDKVNTYLKKRLA